MRERWKTKIIRIGPNEGGRGRRERGGWRRRGKCDVSDYVVRLR